MWKISLNKPCIDIKEHVAVGDVLKSGMLSQGKVVEEFEEKVRRYCGARYAVAVSSCTAGLYLALRTKLTYGIAKLQFQRSHSRQHNAVSSTSVEKWE